MRVAAVTAVFHHRLSVRVAVAEICADGPALYARFPTGARPVADCSLSLMAGVRSDQTFGGRDVGVEADLTLATHELYELRL